MEKNWPLIEKVLDHVTAHPDELDMGVWAQSNAQCGTTACFAGWAIILGTNAELVNGNSYLNPDGADYCRLDGEILEIDEVAAELLGLDGDQDDLFFMERFDECLEDEALVVRPVSDVAYLQWLVAKWRTEEQSQEQQPVLEFFDEA
jgi:hypothetical protein